LDPDWHPTALTELQGLLPFASALMIHAVANRLTETARYSSVQIGWQATITIRGKNGDAPQDPVMGWKED